MNIEKEFPLSTKHFLIALGIFILVMNSTLFTNALVDWDEIVYLHLSENMGWLLDNYTLHGSFIENTLSHNVYSAPVFYHPPLIPYIIKIFSVVFTPIISAKVVNLIFIILSYFLIFQITSILSDYRGAFIALSLWAVCPIFNLESHLIHLDFPLGVFILLGIWFYLQYQRCPEKQNYFFLSALAFVFAMLAKYTGPIYALIPFCLVIAGSTLSRDKKASIIFFLILLIGLSWWFYIFMKYGSLMPSEFSGHREGKMFSSPYLKSILQRKWYDIWLYFAAICPLFFVYVSGAVNYLIELCRSPKLFQSDSSGFRILAVINISVIACTMLFSVINAYSNGYWTMRHIFPIYPIIYITIGTILSFLFSKSDKKLNSYLLIFMFLNMVFMSFSTMITTLNYAGLKAIPAFYLWIPGLYKYFH